ncbi:MAG: GNAT family N-acetyltransferase [Patescibacteria group bacterium]
MIACLDGSFPPFTNPDLLIDTIYKICCSEKTLGIRSKGLLKKNLVKETFVFAYVNKTLIGWIEREKITASYGVVSNLYVYPQFRREGVSRGLILKAFEDLSGTNTLATTSNEGVAKFITERGFEKIEFSLLPLIVKLKLYLRYLNRHAIQNFMKLRKNKFESYLRRCS